MRQRRKATTREQIRALLNDRAAAITARDAPRAVAYYAPEVVSFTLARRCVTPGMRLATRSASRAGSAGRQITHENDSTPFYCTWTARAGPQLT
jgi:ketosteroid isomerase-like protein